jgi:biopolymer transport protein ExbD
MMLVEPWHDGNVGRTRWELSRTAGKLALLLLLAGCSRNDPPPPSDEMTEGVFVTSSGLSAVRVPAAFAMRLVPDASGTILEISEVQSDGEAPALRLTTGERSAHLKRLRTERGNVRIDIFADRGAPHSEVLALMTDLREGGFTKLQFGMNSPKASPSH